MYAETCRKASATDSLSAIKSYDSEDLSTAAEYLAVKFHRVREAHRSGEAEARYRPTDQLPPDGLTKFLDRIRFARFRDMLQVVVPPYEHLLQRPATG